MKTQVTDTGKSLAICQRYVPLGVPAWPCSELSGKRLFVEYDRGGLVDLAINGRMGDCPDHELSAIVSDHLRGKLPAGHPCETYLEQHA